MALSRVTRGGQWCRSGVAGAGQARFRATGAGATHRPDLNPDELTGANASEAPPLTAESVAGLGGSARRMLG